MNVKTITAIASLVIPMTSWSADTADSKFYTTAAQGGMAEVELGNLAQQKSSNASVKEFGAMMASDHGMANEKLKSMADSKSVSLPSTIGVKQMAVKAKLQMLSGDAFDKAYVKDMIKDHQEDIAMFEKEASQGLDADAKAFASATLPTLRTHLKKIQAIADNNGVTAAN